MIDGFRQFKGSRGQSETAFYKFRQVALRKTLPERGGIRLWVGSFFYNNVIPSGFLNVFLRQKPAVGAGEQREFVNSLYRFFL